MSRSVASAPSFSCTWAAFFISISDMQSPLTTAKVSVSISAQFLTAPAVPKGICSFTTVIPQREAKLSKLSLHCMQVSIISPMPFFLSIFTTASSTAASIKSTRGLGREQVSGRRRSPLPPARITAFILHLLCEFVAVRLFISVLPYTKYKYKCDIRMAVYEGFYSAETALLH